MAESPTTTAPDEAAELLERVEPREAARDRLDPYWFAPVLVGVLL